VIDAEEAARTAVRELTDEARPVFLGDRVLLRIRRRNRRASVGVAVILAALAAIVVGWPSGASREVPSAVVPVDPPASPAGAEPWRRFTGLTSMPSVADGRRTNRLVVAARATSADGPVSILDPTTGRYRPSGVAAVLAVSPDLRFAVVARQAPDSAAGSMEYGVYDTAADGVLGRFDLGARLGQDELSRAVWSPDGRSVALSVRRAGPDLGWQAVKLLVVDARTGAVAAAEIRPRSGLEPVEMLGWTTDSQAVVFTADRTGTDEAPSGHIVYDLSGTGVAAHRWSQPSNPVPVLGTDELALVPIDGEQITVIGVRDGSTRRHYLTRTVNAVRGWDSPMAWRGDEMVLWPDAAVILGVSAVTGASRVLSTFPQSPQTLVIAPAPEPTGPVTALTW
jgi:hypothetical protein